MMILLSNFSAAALRVLSYLPLPYSALSSLMIIPTPLRDAVYDYVAKNRYDWFGKDDDCLVLKETELLERFVDWEELLHPTLKQHSGKDIEEQDGIHKLIKRTPISSNLFSKMLPTEFTKMLLLLELLICLLASSILIATASNTEDLDRQTNVSYPFPQIKGSHFIGSGSYFNDHPSFLPESFYESQTTKSFDYLGLSPDSKTNLLHDANQGDGVIIGVIQLRCWHIGSFSDKGLGPIPAKWKGYCQSGDQFDPKKHCNRKLIGARYFIDGFIAGGEKPYNGTQNREFISPRDSSGHGTHCASTAAGSFETAIHDGVEVLSVSLGKPRISLYREIDQQDLLYYGSFHAVAHGITIVCSGGNIKPKYQTIKNGQSEHKKKKRKNLLKYTFFFSYKDYFDRRLVAGKVVLCFITSADNIIITANNVRMSGGKGIIAASEIGIPPVITKGFPVFFSCHLVSYDIGTEILNYIQLTREPRVQLKAAKTYISKQVSTYIADFSSRGPNSISPAILKPDIAAPGVDILAASIPKPGKIGLKAIYVLKYGTSMATPHVAGEESRHCLNVCILNWPRVADPFDYGGGIVNPNVARNPAYLCGMGYSETAISQLTGQVYIGLDVNIPSITVLRKVKNVGSPNSKYQGFVDPPRGTTVKVKPMQLSFSNKVSTEYYFVGLTWTDGVRIPKSHSNFQVVGRVWFVSQFRDLVGPAKTNINVLWFMLNRQFLWHQNIVSNDFELPQPSFWKCFSNMEEQSSLQIHSHPSV
ncbi:hypothetical protein ACJIZ3_017852 [Penstemon smallii]|uniref:Peptidase S8/S53 domain-containing protein n=1 Tax=Penstemon smallii TaxID=265156 RepID=A0ABD3SX69_9LAMI